MSGSSHKLAALLYYKEEGDKVKYKLTDSMEANFGYKIIKICYKII